MAVLLRVVALSHSEAVLFDMFSLRAISPSEWPASLNSIALFLIEPLCAST
ncbi:MAG: hypothetical protein UY22_C0044G0015 [Candidatus Amesbacteria bacterium GW2011_GWC1_48_10]|uniref:Uncharacterized protein n=1 Tax=Candidatus Amesbacteria bacterium GW2011_GWC1_48_10 TaxID=1618365 RepID=A0A0G1UB47_9BACT|nr:MAG: hypothetical protein UY22_C0044G0015 [Candidatus Amesbacteria bacterium GW2011_GWC1_48_10]